MSYVRVRRRRGATFTIIVLVTSAILLAIGGAFVDSSRQVGTLAGMRERQDEAKEALAGGAVWARVALEGWSAGRTTETAVLKFSKASVAVELKATGDGAAAGIVATVAPDTKIAGRAVLAKKDGHWVVAKFEIPESR